MEKAYTERMHENRLERFWLTDKKEEIDQTIEAYLKEALELTHCAIHVLILTDHTTQRRKIADCKILEHQQDMAQDSLLITFTPKGLEELTEYSSERLEQLETEMMSRTPKLQWFARIRDLLQNFFHPDRKMIRQTKRQADRKLPIDDLLHQLGHLRVLKILLANTLQRLKGENTDIVQSDDW